MKKIILIVLFLLIIAGSSVFLTYLFDKPVPPVKVYKIGIITRGQGYDSAIRGYKSKLENLGYREGMNVNYIFKTVSTKDEIEEAVRNMIYEKADLIHTYSTPVTQAAYKATKDASNPIPVVFGSIGDPLIAGVVKDVRKPGTNVTGVMSLSTELTSKRIEILKQLVPDIKKVAMPHSAKIVGDVAANKSVEIAGDTAKNLGIELVFYPVSSKEENPSVAKQIFRKNAEGMIIGGDSLIWGGISLFIEQAINEKLPFAVFDLDQVKKGALVGLGPDYRVSGEQAAVITHQILRGKSPAEISVEVPQKLLLSVNTQTAKKIGLKIDPWFLKQTDVIVSE